MKRLCFIVLAVLNQSIGKGVIASDTAMQLTESYCAKNKCNTKLAVNYAIHTALEGTCIVFSSSSNLKTISVNKQSNKDWWIVTEDDLKGDEYQSMIAFAKMFSQSTSKQVYLAEPVRDIKTALADYCISTYHDFKFGHQKSIGFVVPKT